MKLEIEIFTELDGQHQEELEDKLGKTLQDFGIEGEITNSSTGNSVTVLQYPKF